MSWAARLLDDLAELEVRALEEATGEWGWLLTIDACGWVATKVRIWSA